MIFDRAIRNMSSVTGKTQIISLDSTSGWEIGAMGNANASESLKISAVNRAVNCLSDSMSKLPINVYGSDRKKIENHPLNRLLRIRPNEAMTPSVYKKLMENRTLLLGNGYALIFRSGRTATPMELLPIKNCLPHMDVNGKLWYVVTNPRTGEMRKLSPFDVIHYKAYTDDGINGISVLTHAAETVRNARASQRYEGKFFAQNAQPSGVLSVDGDLDKEAKDKVRSEWSKIHSGVDNAFRIAVLDNGLKYQAISISNRDAQFVESKAVTVEDIARFFGVPLHKLYAGKQSYNSNEQNGIEYVVDTLHPIVTQWDEEDSYKLLFDREINAGLWVTRNLMAELKGDVKSRGQWYRIMREIGVYSPNDISELEDRPDVPGGDTRYASLNYIPLEDFQELSRARNQSGGSGQ